LRLIEATSEVEATIKWAANKKLHLEIALIRAIQTLSEVSLNTVIDALENLRDGSPPLQRQKIGNASTVEKPLSKALEKQQPTVEQTVAAARRDRKPADKPVQPEATVQVPETKPELTEPGDSAWALILNTIRTRRPLIVSWLELATPFFPERGTLKLAFPNDQGIAVESLSRPNNRKLIEEVAGEILGGTWKLEFEFRENLPGPGKVTAEAQKPADSMEEFRNDPMIQKALELFKAEIQAET